MQAARHEVKESLFTEACPREMLFLKTESYLTDSVPPSLGSSTQGDGMQLIYLWRSLQ